MTALRLDILPDSQKLLWQELAATPKDFTLYGGTAIALQLGHRQSVDFDFFVFKTFVPGELYPSVPFLANAQILQQSANTLTCIVHRPAPVRISFFGLPALRRIEKPLLADNNIGIASLTDLAGTKASVVQQRPEAKDYLDLDALMAHGVGLPVALAAAKSIYGHSFNPQITLKALSYFADGDLPSLPEPVKKRLAMAAAAIDLSRLPEIQCLP